jgi:hypothetical protein
MGRQYTREEETMVRILCAAAVACCLLGVAQPAGAAAEWCEFDPVVLIVTPAGALVLVFVTNGAQGAEHSVSAQLAQMRYTTQHDQSGKATLVSLQVLVRGDLFAATFPTRSTASTGPLATGNIFGRAQGVSGDTMHLSFVLDTP